MQKGIGSRYLSKLCLRMSNLGPGASNLVSTVIKMAYGDAEERLQNSELPEFVKHPILLDKKHYFTKLVVKDCHARVLHNGMKETLTQLSWYWIAKGRQFVRKLLSECRLCKHFNASPFKGTSTPSLPQFRVQESPHFHSTGVDYAGPLYLKGGEKVWICLFTCCVTRAVHLEWLRT